MEKPPEYGGFSDVRIGAGGYIRSGPGPCSPVRAAAVMVAVAVETMVPPASRRGLPYGSETPAGASGRHRGSCRADRPSRRSASSPPPSGHGVGAVAQPRHRIIQPWRDPLRAARSSGRWRGRSAAWRSPAPRPPPAATASPGPASA